MFGLGFTEILLILAVALLVLGPKKLPEVARTLGRTLAQLKHSLEDIRREISLPRIDLRQELSLDDQGEQSAPEAEVTIDPTHYIENPDKKPKKNQENE